MVDYIKDLNTEKIYIGFGDMPYLAIIEALCEQFGIQFVADKNNYTILDNYITENLRIYQEKTVNRASSIMNQEYLMTSSSDLYRALLQARAMFANIDYKYVIDSVQDGILYQKKGIDLEPETFIAFDLKNKAYSKFSWALDCEDNYISEVENITLDEHEAINFQLKVLFFNKQCLVNRRGYI